MLGGRYIVDETLDALRLARDDEAGAVEFRKGFFLGDGTGSGRAGKPLASSSTTGCAAAARRSGFQKVTSCSLIPKEIGPRLGKRSS